MKILIVSDTHRKNENFCRVIEKEGRVDMVVHLGDAEGSEYYLQKVAGCPMEVVAGNNDFFSELPKEKELDIGGYRVLLTHGHYYYVSVGMERIKEEGISRGADIVMFGHTHRPLLDMEDEITVLNPGSLSFPRQAGRQPSYIMMEINEDGEAQFEIRYL